MLQHYSYRSVSPPTNTSSVGAKKDKNVNSGKRTTRAGENGGNGKQQSSSTICFSIKSKEDVNLDRHSTFPVESSSSEDEEEREKRRVERAERRRKRKQKEKEDRERKEREERDRKEKEEKEKEEEKEESDKSGDNEDDDDVYDIFKYGKFCRNDNSHF